MGNISLKLKNYSNAFESFQKALDIGSELNVPEIIWRAHLGLALVEENKGQVSRAVDHNKIAVATIEKARGGIPDEGLKLVFLENNIQAYEKLIQLLFTLYKTKSLDSGHAREAFHYAERAKARSLLDILAESKVNIRRGIEPALLEQEKEIFRVIARLQTDLRNKQLNDSLKTDIYNKLAAEEEKLATLQLELRQKSPDYADLKYPKPLTLAGVQDSVLTAKDVLLEYSLGEEHSYLWAITKNKNYMFQLSAQSEIVEQVKKYLAIINHPPQPGRSPASLGAILYDMLIKPANKFLQNKSNLIIIPDGILHYLPFEALVSVEKNQPQYLIETINISYAPSASVLGFIQNQPKKLPPANQRELLAFGDPVFGDESISEKREMAASDSAAADSSSEDVTERGLYESVGFKFQRLLHTATEIKKIASQFDSTRRLIYLRNEAKEERLKAETLRQYRYLHFATHGVLDEQTPGRSAIVLTLDEDPTEDGFLQMTEIFNLALEADLVVLSACQTGKGKLLRGEGVIGMTRAFMYAGARSLLVSLWPVNDRSTADFMANFYDYMQRGKAKNEALRQAKLDMIKGADAALHHPYFWAPFVLTGDNK